MGKVIFTLVILIIALTIFFGCTTAGTDSNVSTPVKINSPIEANEAINDVSTDISGISNLLDEIDNTLTDSNA